MSTSKQKKVAQLIVKNSTLDKPLNGGEIVEISGYGKSMSKNSHVVLNSQGVQEELEVLGFNEVSAKGVVAEILLNPKANATDRLKAADQVFKVRGSYAPEKSVNLNIQAEITDPKARKLAEKYEQELKNEL